MTTAADKIASMSEVERALLLSLLNWRSTKRNKKRTQADAMKVFQRAAEYLTRNVDKKVLRIMCQSGTAGWPDQLRRIMLPYINGDAPQDVTMRQLEERMAMIETWPEDWLNQA